MDDPTTDGNRVIPPRRALFLRLWGPPLAYTAIIFLLSFIPVGSPPRIWSAQDKAAHFLEFALLSALLFRALRPGGGLLRTLLIAFLASTGMGVLVELVQALIPSRSAEFLDVAADAAGALAGALAAVAVFRGQRGPGPHSLPVVRGP